MYAFRWIVSLLFSIQIYIAMLFVGLWYLIPTMINRENAYKAVHRWCNWVRISARVMLNLKSEVRGTVPTEECLIASKHQSFLDIIIIASSVPRPKFIMKRELMWAPILGYYALRVGCVPVNRGKRGSAVLKMKADVKAGTSLPGQLVIYPQGTRVAPGVQKPYKIGAGLLYEQLDQPCYPVAANVGIFWPRRGVMRNPGVAVIEFLPVIEPKMPIQQFMKTLETVIETNSNRLMEEAGFKP